MGGWLSRGEVDWVKRSESENLSQYFLQPSRVDNMLHVSKRVSMDGDEIWNAAKMLIRTEIIFVLKWKRTGADVPSVFYQTTKNRGEKHKCIY